MNNIKKYIKSFTLFLAYSSSYIYSMERINLDDYTFLNLPAVKKRKMEENEENSDKTMDYLKKKIGDQKLKELIHKVSNIPFPTELTTEPEYKTLNNGSTRDLYYHFKNYPSIQKNVSTIYKHLTISFEPNEIVDDEKQWTLLHYLASIGARDACRSLIEEHKFNPLLEDKEGQTPEEIARKNGRTKAASFLKQFN